MFDQQPTSTTGYWKHITVRSDDPLNIHWLQRIIGVSRTFVRSGGEWSEIGTPAEEYVDQLFRNGWELVNQTQQMYPNDRLVREWIFKKWEDYNQTTNIKSRISPKDELLNNLAFSLLNSEAVDESSLVNALLQVRADCVYPLFFAFCQILEESRLDQRYYGAFGQILIWDLHYQSRFRKMLTVIEKVGEPATRDLCTALKDNDQRIRYLASLILHYGKIPLDKRRLKQIADVLEQHRIDEIGHHDSLPLHELLWDVPLTALLAKNGYRKEKRNLTRIMRDSYKAEHEFVESAVNEMKLHLIS